MNVAAVIQWIRIGQQVVEAGTPAFNAVVAALHVHGIQADTDELDKVIADADRRKAIAEAEARGDG